MRYRRKLIGIILRRKTLLLPCGGEECNEKEEKAIPELYAGPIRMAKMHIDARCRIKGGQTAGNSIAK
jgi:hypothetical protein